MVLIGRGDVVGSRGREVYYGRFHGGECGFKECVAIDSNGYTAE